MHIRALAIAAGALLVWGVVVAQQATQLNLGTQATNADFAGFPFTRPMKTGLLRDIGPNPCSPGMFYFATDQPAGGAIETCSAPGIWTQLLNLGGSGGLQLVGGSLDINLAIVPRLTGANTFTGRAEIQNGLSLATAQTQPDCTDDLRGTFWYQKNGALKDSVQVCFYDGVSPRWVSLL